jgi:hypothetical protein
VTRVTARFPATVETYISAAGYAENRYRQIQQFAIQGGSGGGEKRNRPHSQPLLSLPASSFALRRQILI